MSSISAHSPPCLEAGWCGSSAVRLGLAASGWNFNFRSFYTTSCERRQPPARRDSLRHTRNRMSSAHARDGQDVARSTPRGTNTPPSAYRVGCSDHSDQGLGERLHICFSAGLVNERKEVATPPRVELADASRSNVNAPLGSVFGWTVAAASRCGTSPRSSGPRPPPRRERATAGPPGTAGERASRRPRRGASRWHGLHDFASAWRSSTGVAVAASVQQGGTSVGPGHRRSWPRDRGRPGTVAAW